jgi:hypothetical protein
MTPPPATDLVTATAAALFALPACSVGPDGVPPLSVAALAALARSRGLALPDGRALTFAPLAPGRTADAGAALDWESAIAATACVRLREGSWHDAFNATAWLAFPRTKAALNAVHVAAGVVAAGGAVAAPVAASVAATTAATGANARTRARDAATLLDESGILVACADARIVGAWREHRWRDAFGDAATLGASLAAWVIGHGVLDKLRAPFPALTAKALVLPMAPSALPVEAEARRAIADRCAADWIAARGAAFAPADLVPLPLAALPGLTWPPLAGRPPMSAEPRRFDDVAVFRPARRGSPAVV